MRSSNAAQPYGQLGVRGGSARETEGRALLESARRMAEALKAPEDTTSLLATVRLNWRLWTIFQAEISNEDTGMPDEIRTNMLNLCNFVDKHTVDILADPQPEKFEILINVNRQIASGLLVDPEQMSLDKAGAPESGPQGSSTGDLSV